MPSGAALSDNLADGTAPARTRSVRASAVNRGTFLSEDAPPKTPIGN
jgi:hypothetical protein